MKGLLDFCKGILNAFEEKNYVLILFVLVVSVILVFLYSLFNGNSQRINTQGDQSPAIGEDAITADSFNTTGTNCIGGDGGDGGAVSAIIPADMIAGDCEIVTGEGGKAGEAGGDTYLVCPKVGGGYITVGASGGAPGGTGCINNY